MKRSEPQVFHTPTSDHKIVIPILYPLSNLSLADFTVLLDFFLIFPESMT